MLAASLGTIALNSPAQSPELTPELVDQFRITAFEIGTLGNWRINNYMIHESDALVLTRTALGEAPDSLEDRIYVMWLIRIRAALGYKNGRWSYIGTDDRWGMPSTIKMEALCVGGCQFEPWKAATYVLDPSKLSPTSNLRLMLHPTDEQLPLFYETYLHALDMLEQPIVDAPEPIRGYDGFRSPTVSDTHYIDWKPNGLPRTQFFEGGNVWVDHAKQDNRFWVLLPGRLAMTALPTPAPSATMTVTASPAATRTSTPEPTVTLTSAPVFATLEPDPPAAVDRSTKEVQMKLATRTHPLVVVALGIFLILSLSAFLLQADLPEGVEAAIAGVISFVVMILGPKPLKSIYDAIGLPGGAVRVIATYVVSLVIGAGALFIAGAVSGVPADLDSILALGGLLLAASGVAFQRLKDRGAFNR